MARANNCAFLEVAVQAWPVLMLATTADVPRGRRAAGRLRRRRVARIGLLHARLRSLQRGASIAIAIIASAVYRPHIRGAWRTCAVQHARLCGADVRARGACGGRCRACRGWR
jgi:hypothetical protein